MLLPSLLALGGSSALLLGAAEAFSVPSPRGAFISTTTLSRGGGHGLVTSFPRRNRSVLRMNWLPGDDEASSTKQPEERGEGKDAAEAAPTAADQQPPAAPAAAAAAAEPAEDDDTYPKPPGHDEGILITWDLDDTLYPLTPVIGRANIAFNMCMSKLGYKDVSPRDINKTVKSIRQEMLEDPELYPPTYAQLRMKAIRREMVRFITLKNLEAVAVDEGTDVDKLTAPIRTLAENKAQQSLDNSAVRTVYDAWESERHQAADANVYPDVVPILRQLRRDYPRAVMGAVTNGAANPLKMPLTLAPHFDFCVSWGDDGIARKPDGAIYEAAVAKYGDYAKDKGGKPMKVWIHVGDDLAYDVGGSSAVGAKTIWTDLTEDYGQTAEARLWNADFRPSWSTAPEDELERRRKAAEDAKKQVTQTVRSMGEIPLAVRKIVRDVLDE